MATKRTYLNAIGKYSLLVWMTASIFRIILQYFYGYYSLVKTFGASNEDLIIVFLEALPHLLKETFLGLPIFYLLCWLLYKFSRVSTHFKLKLSIFALLYGIHIYYNIEYSKFVSMTEQFISKFIIYCVTLLTCIWLFNIHDDGKFENDNNILDAPLSS